MFDNEEEKYAKELWLEIKILVEAIDKDMSKNLNKKNSSAGIRARHAMRSLKLLLTEAIKLTCELDKTEIENRKARKSKRK